MTINVQEAIDRFREKPAPVFGGLLAWDIPDAGSVTRIEVQEALERVGLNSNLLEEPSVRRVIKLALEEFERTNSSAGRLFVREIKSTTEEIVYGIVEEGKDTSADRLYYQHETTVRVKRDDGTFSGFGPHAESVEALYNHYQQHPSPDDLQRVMREVAHRVRALPKRRYGGTYFYAGTDKNIMTVAAVEQWVKSLGLPRSHVTNEPVSGGPIQKTEVFYSLSGEVRKQVDGIKKAAENITRRAENLHNHEQQLLDVQEMMDMYLALTDLEEQQDEREAEVNEMRQLIRDVSNFIVKKRDEIEEEASKVAKKAS